LDFLDKNYLSQFEHLEIDSKIKHQPLWDVPKRIQVTAPAPKEDDGTATVAVVWIFGNTTDPVTTLGGRILAHYLLGTESSPLKRALIDSGLGEDLDDISGFDSELIQTIFAAGLRKSKVEYADKIQKLILDTLENQINNGLDKDLLEGAIRQIEFSLREITSSHFPYNLRLAERCYRSWIYDGDPLAHLAFEKPLSIIKKEHEKGQSFFINLLKSNLFNNTHRLLSIVEASSEKGKQLEQQTEEQALKLTADFSQADKQRCFELTNVLLKQQMTPPSSDILAALPKLQKADLPRKGKDVPAIPNNLDGLTAFTHPIFTSGVVYFDIGFNFQSLPSRLLPFVAIYSELITRCGSAGFSYEENAKRIALATGGVDASVSCKTKPGTEDELFFYGFIHGKSIISHFDEMLTIIKELLLAPDLANKKQIKDILLEERNSLHSSIIGSGHQFAISQASSYLSKSKYLDEVMGGIAQLRFLDDLIKKDDLKTIVESIAEIHRLVINKNSAFISITADEPSLVLPSVKQFLQALPSFTISIEQYQNPESIPKRPIGVEINSAVNFVSRIWKMPPATPQRFGLQYLISRYLSTGYLWDKVRVEGGAYGGMSISSITHPIFACASYRDPNLLNTLTHFEKGLESVAGGIAQDKIDQNIIGAIGKIDAPQPPHTQGFSEAMDLMMGYTKEFRQNLRDVILGANTADIKAAAQRILATKENVISVFGGGGAFDIARESGFDFHREPLLP
jgi:Zn-dependent M16 (insulinase) family peptidase